jgi:hypothetical protein
LVFARKIEPILQLYKALHSKDEASSHVVKLGSFEVFTTYLFGPLAEAAEVWPSPTYLLWL